MSLVPMPSAWVSPASGLPSLPGEFEAAAAVDARLEIAKVVSTR